MNEMMKMILKEFAESNQIKSNQIKSNQSNLIKNPFNSADEFRAAAKNLGHSDEEIEKALEGFDGFPLDESVLDNISGGHPYYIL